MADDATQVRWLVAGPISSEPTGDTFTLQRNDFMQWLEARRPRCEVSIKDGLGGADARTATLEVTKLRDLTLKEVIGAVPEFGKLLKIANDPATAEQTIAAVEAVVGKGALTARLAEIAGIEAAPTESVPDAVDAMLDEVGAPKVTKPAAAAAVDAFLRSATKSPRTVRKSKSARQLRDAIEEEVYREAKALLESPEVQALEGPLRGLWLFAGQCPKSSGGLLEVLDVPLKEVASRIADRPRGDLVDEPDAIFVPFPIKDSALLIELAELGEALLCPVVVDVAPELLGQPSTDALNEALEDLDPKNAASAWLSLRQEESSRWLCAVANGVILAAEGTGVAKRVLIGSGVWAFGAIVSKSFAQTGSFARITQRPGALQAPGVRTLESGRHEGMAAPTEVFIHIRGQSQFAKHGMIALGSSRNSDQVILAATPMVRASSDSVPFPAQLLTGRIVRFAGWVRDQLPPGADADTARSVFKEAAKVFLFPGMSEVGEVDATIKEEEDGTRQLSVYANISPLHAGIPFELAFPLPLE